MSNKTTLSSLIATNLASGSPIPASKHREVETALLNELYGTAVNDTQATTNVLTADDAATKEYTVEIVKQGREVTISGFIKNNTASMIAGEVFFTINVGDYTQNATVKTFFGNLQTTGANVRMALGASTLTLIDTIGAGATVFFNVTYNVNA